MEILVHNISHADFICEIHSETRNETTFSRPKFSSYDPISRQCKEAVDEITGAGAKETTLNSRHSTSAPAHERLMHHPQYIFNQTTTCSTTEYPTGFRFQHRSCSSNASNAGSTSIPKVFDLKSFRIKDEELERSWSTCLNKMVTETDSVNPNLVIRAIYFPLLAILLPKWIGVLKAHESQASQRIVYLVSGSGIPRNVRHDQRGNSTEELGKLMQMFIEHYYPQVQVHQIHSGSNIFRYDENVTFVNTQLRPLIESHRAEIVNLKHALWKNHFHVTLAYADGAPARVSALNASLRLYTPSYLHIWQLKTFWHEAKLSLEDVDFHSFHNIETIPPQALTDIRDRGIQETVHEMKRYSDDVRKHERSSNELAGFWLRKTKKPVLAILYIEKDLASGGETRLYRGINVEVSMPTGSLCAERNVIGTALASDPSLLREDIKYIAVLSLSELNPSVRTDSTRPSPARSIKTSLESCSPVSSPKKRPRTYSCDQHTLDDRKDLNPLAPCGACREWLLKIAEANPALKIITFTDATCDHIYINQLS